MLRTLMIMLALSVAACGESDDTGLVPMMTGGSNAAGNMAAGNTGAGATGAGVMTAGNMIAGTMTAGNMTAGNMTAGTMTAGTEGGSTIVPPMDDIGRCLRDV